MNSQDTPHPAAVLAQEHNHIRFYGAWYCPFAQRTWIALEYLQMAYTYREVDPYHKTDQWLAVSRGMGQVPVLEVHSQDGVAVSVVDSLRTLEYLDDLSNNISLFPVGPGARADARFWIDFQGRRIIPQFYRFLKAPVGSTAGHQSREEMLAGLIEITIAMSANGPYFFGEAPGIVDWALAPFVARIYALLSYYKDFHLPQEREVWVRLAAWWVAVETHPAFVSTMPDPETYRARLREFYLPYSKGGGQEDVTEISA